MWPGYKARRHCVICDLQLANSDHTDTVLRTVFVKYDVVADPDDYAIFQTLPDGSGQSYCALNFYTPR